MHKVLIKRTAIRTKHKFCLDAPKLSWEILMTSKEILSPCVCKPPRLELHIHMWVCLCFQYIYKSERERETMHLSILAEGQLIHCCSCMRGTSFGIINESADSIFLNDGRSCICQVSNQNPSWRQKWVDVKRKATISRHTPRLFYFAQMAIALQSLSCTSCCWTGWWIILELPWLWQVFALLHVVSKEHAVK